MPRIEQDRLELVGARLGEAVLDPAAWPGLMEEICGAVGAVGAALLQSDVRTSDIPRTEGVDEVFRAYFAEGWHTRDIRAERGVPLMLRDQRTVVTDQDIVTPEEMRRCGYYKDLQTPHGVPWWAAVGFRAGSALWGLTLHRSDQQGPFEADETRVLAQISERLTDVATLSKAVGRQVLLGISNALELVRQPAIALDRQGCVLEANAAAQNLFGTEIGIRERRLWVRDRLAKFRLDSLVDQVRTSADDAVVRAWPIAVRRECLPLLLIRALPIPGPARSPFLGARILLILSNLVPKARPDPAVLREIFGLTHMEAKVASVISTGASPEQAAVEMGIAVVTARNHLKAVFAKTGTHRQSELVALLAALSANCFRCHSRRLSSSW
jgi:DNA-binding CsgD family transcriptional regulator/PAS domain-containing protein